MPAIDITGQRFGRLIALNPTLRHDGARNIIWKFRCDCGKIAFVGKSHLRSGNTKSCGCYHKECATVQAIAIGRKCAKDITGQRFIRLVAIKPTNKRCGNSIIWECQCDCGKIALADVGSLLSGCRKSCGCLQYAAVFVRGTNMDSMDVPIEITHLMQARGKLKRAIKEAS